MKLVKTKDFFDNGVHTKKYYFCGIRYLKKKWAGFFTETYLFKFKISGHGTNKNNKNLFVMKSPDRFVFNKTEKPVVSIIIPCYNQYKYTKNCLYSILQNTDDIDYEIIIADDNSNDKTKEIGKYIKNINIIRNKENLRFLKNCNNAAKFARGKYILFLNNDTQVMKNWLKPLVDLMESDNTIGMTGSMLLYPDKTVQEAGGIIYQDASGCNYGRNSSDYNSGAFNYVKDVDYISGAAIMLSRKNWKKLNGFDETFSPAYYEDTDLAFRIRNELKLRVVYQPLSKVIHFEGKSNGTDLSSGQKQYQVVNAEKFYNKWQKVLKKYHCTRDDIFHARDKSKNKKCLLFIDFRYLTFDNDCGSRASFKYLQFFIKHGFNVKYLAMSKGPMDYHKTAIEQLGAEIICYNDWFNTDIVSWLKENGKYIDYVYLNRPNVAEWCLKWLQEYTNAKIIYQGHDLHHLRMMREYQTNPSEKLLQDTNDMEKLEKEILPQMDTVLYFSDVEIQKIKEMKLKIKDIDTVPLYIFDKPSDIKYNAGKRHDIMFIGGYNHVPNQDAARWLINEIMPRVWAEKPDIKIHLVGSNMPQDLYDMASQYKNIVIDGFLTDDELNEMYKKIKISFIPLRFGAGIKGKIVEAIYNNIPVITTSIGAEGISANRDFLTVYDDAENLAKAIINMYDDNEKLQKISDASAKFIMDNFSEKAVLSKLKNRMGIK